MARSQEKPRLALALLVCGLASFFYVYDFILRVMPGAMTSELMTALNTSATGLGILSSAFFYGYAPMQIPAGLLLDKIGPRKLLSINLLICAVATVVFGFSTNLTLSTIARFAMGFTASFSYLGALMLISRWFPAKYYASSVGLVQFMGSIGAIAGLAPIAYLIKIYGPQTSTLGLAAIGFVFATLFWIVIRDFPETHKMTIIPAKHRSWERLKQAAGIWQNWWIGFYGFTCWAPMSIFAALWGVPFLKIAYQQSAIHAARDVSCIWLGVAIGGPILGWLTVRIQRRKFPLHISALIGIISTLLVIYCHLPKPFLLLALFAMGVASSAQAITFALIKDSNPHHIIGTTSGLNNMMIILGGMLFLPMVGLMLDHFWSGAMLDSMTKIYSVTDYRLSLLMLPLLYTFALLCSLFAIKETYCKAKYEH